MSQPPRIAPVEPPYSPEVARILDRWMSRVPPRFDTLRIFRTFAVHPELATRAGVLGAGLLAHGHVPPREREIVIHRITARAGAEYEWGTHTVLLGRDVGLTEAQIRATVRGDADDPAWGPRDAMLIRMADALFDHDDIDDALWTQLAAIWPVDQLLELVITAGWYRAVSLVINVSRVRLEDWADRFP